MGGRAAGGGGIELSDPRQVIVLLLAGIRHGMVWLMICYPICHAPRFGSAEERSQIAFPIRLAGMAPW